MKKEIRLDMESIHHYYNFVLLRQYYFYHQK